MKPKFLLQQAGKTPSRPTTIVIAHRLSTTFHADRIVVLKGIRIIENREPSPAPANGYYASLVDRQARACSVFAIGAGKGGRRRLNQFNLEKRIAHITFIDYVRRNEIRRQ